MIQLEFDFTVQPVVMPAPVVSYSCSRKEFEESQATERDYMYGRAAFLYKDLERWLSEERKRRKAEEEYMR